MKSKHISVPLIWGWHVSLTVLPDLGLWKPTKDSAVIAGWQVRHNIRIDAATRCSKWGFAFLFVVVTLSKMWVRR